MSNLFGPGRALNDPRSVPQGDTVGSYTSYLDAQKAVDYLADQQFPVEQVSIVGNDLKMVERVTGRLSYPRVALSGAFTGAWFGLFVGVVLSMFGSNPGESIVSIPVAMLLGACFWMLFGIVSYAAQRGKRDFTSTSQVIASSYDVLVGREVSGQARQLLQKLPMSSGQRPPHQHLPHNPNQTRQPHQPSNPDHPSNPGEPSNPGQPSWPQSWNNPWDQSRDQTGQNDQRGQSGHSQDQPAQPVQAPFGAADAALPAQSAAEPTPTPASTRRYPDLPDGRPQYGIRVDPDAPSKDPGGQDSPKDH
ncbi:general stress protein [Psychromicrobium xiongbiense]|uniref:general stress protein n=1 Tax=Psychromicrobium xiongbiense TaxID=3051184 RepID=UPI0025558A9D|nr:general stress protein [Psychromicrobium sp. YIM S02556]